MSVSSAGDDGSGRLSRSSSRTGRESVASLGRRTPSLQDEGVVSSTSIEPAALLAMQNEMQAASEKGMTLTKYKKLRLALLWMLALDGLFSIAWILVLIYAYNL